MAGTTNAPAKAWTAVIMMIVGFTICTLAFILHNNLALWIIGGLIGAVGLLTAKLVRLMDMTH